MDKYKEASIQKLRFPTGKGSNTVEDLHDLTLAQLDATAKIVNKVLKTSGEESFINEVSKESATARLALDIIKDVIADKKAEQANARNRVANKAKKEQLLALKAERQSASLKSLSDEDLDAQLADLG